MLIEIEISLKYIFVKKKRRENKAKILKNVPDNKCSVQNNFNQALNLMTRIALHALMRFNEWFEVLNAADIGKNKLRIE